ncbi:AbrB/MazE/SpoVT family DNA-binding domain-containing protein [Sporomusa sphaeroides]|jgi:antitoxin MazE|uniref:AbrB/MazE/SpoVT family DNA-binding domain-containing protein n=1 Tax=Sporomusa sphaeroides TaxID=47679 RepID=UPI003A52108F
MEAAIIRIGNSKGISIPASLLKQCGIDKVIIKVDGSIITLAPVRVPRQGWEQAFKKAGLLIRR